MTENTAPSSGPDTEPVDLEKLMTEVGPLVEAAEVLQYEPHRWLVVFDDDHAVEIEVDVPLAKVVLTTHLGHPPSGDETASYKMLLQLTAMWRETGGLRMAVDPVDDSVIQIYDFPLAGIQLESLAIQLSNFANAALHAGKVLSVNAGTSQEDAPDNSHFVRV
ncbi:MAG: type III secretion system chaperone [Verrucomicrobium sp.]